MVPCRCFPPGVACGAEGEVAVSDSTTSGAAPTSPPEGVFRRTRRWKYRRAVGTHYGPTRIHQADYSPRHRRDGRAGTTILLSSPHLPPGRAASRSDYGPDGAAGVWGNTVVSAGAAGPFRDYGPDGAADAAAESAGAAGPFGDYRPAEATQRVAQDQQLLLCYRAVGPADVQRWIHTYGDRGPAPLACSWK